MLRELSISTKGQKQRFSLNQNAITIGRAPTSSIWLPDEMLVSRQHALIQPSEDGWVLIDLGSTHGTKLNGAPVSAPTRLSEGDRIQIGDVTIFCGDELTSSESNVEILPQASVPAPPDVGSTTLTFRGRRMSVAVHDPTPFAYGRASALFRASANDGKQICIKLFHHVQGDRWENVSAFEREVLAQSNLSHQHIVPVLDYGFRSEPHGNPFVILPYCEGGSLRDLLNERTFYPLLAVLPLLEQIAVALDFAHTSGFVHGDVKPENILLSPERRHAYLSDFGMCNVFAVQERFSTALPGPRGGTTAYFSPEQLSENQQTPLSDIYAFAVVTERLIPGSPSVHCSRWMGRPRRGRPSVPVLL